MIRLYNHKEDFQGVREYCIYHGIAFPNRNSILIVSLNDQGKINGLVGLETKIYVEPLIADNPILANNLGRMIEGIIINEGIKIISASVPRENVKHIKQLEKDGFEITENNHIILEKKYG
jgi:hypothetical protein